MPSELWRQGAAEPLRSIGSYTGLRDERIQRLLPLSLFPITFILPASPLPLGPDFVGEARTRAKRSERRCQGNRLCEQRYCTSIRIREREYMRFGDASIYACSKRTPFNCLSIYYLSKIQIFLELPTYVQASLRRFSSFCCCCVGFYGT